MKHFHKYTRLLYSNLFILLILSAGNMKAQDFSDLEFGTDTTLEIVTWNIEWFPKSGQTTINDVSLIIEALDADVIAVQEIDDKTKFDQMIAALDGWDAYFIYGEYKSLAYIFKEETIELIDAYEIYTSDWRDFPRSPLVIEFLYQGELIVVINNHLKCCGDGFMNLLDDWDEETRRFHACNKLESFIQETYPAEQVILTGDLNDILDDDPVNNVFTAFLDKPDLYRFADMEIALGSSGNWSYPGWPSHLDHILVSDELFYYLTDDDSEVLTIKLNAYYTGGMGEYDSRVSDHLPVGMKLALPETFSVSDHPAENSAASIFPNPANDKIQIHGWDEEASEYVIYNAYGNAVQSGTYSSGKAIEISDLPPGMYYMNVINGYNSQVLKMIKQ